MTARNSSRETTRSMSARNRYYLRDGSWPPPNFGKSMILLKNFGVSKFTLAKVATFKIAHFLGMPLSTVP
jgi:hypothetical protein